jgi:hypothetical protein
MEERMSVQDYTDRFIANLLMGGLVTCLTMSALDYFNWLDEGVAGMQPDVARACLVVGLVAMVLFVLPWLRRVLARASHTRFADTSASARVRPVRLTGVVLGLIAVVSIISQLR